MSEYEYTCGATILQVKGVSKSYDGRVIIRDINLSIEDYIRAGHEQGQVVALLGPSGVGKTTLFRLLSGLEQPDTGEILLGEECAPVTRGQVGVVAQDYRVFPELRVIDNLIVAGIEGAKLSRREAKERALAYLNRFGLAEHARKFPEQLSGGQKQRVAILQQFMCSKHFILMDEPYSGLDPVAKNKVRDLIREVTSLDTLNTIILTTHSVEAAVEIADTIHLLGFERSPEGTLIAGATKVRTFNLLERGLAWRDGIATLPAFHETVDEIKAWFPKLLDPPMPIAA